MHLKCHVHYYRDVLKAQEKVNRIGKKIYKKIKSIREKHQKAIKHLKSNHIKFKCAVHLLNESIQERDDFYDAHNIVKYSKEKRFKRKRDKFKKKINELRSIARNYKKSIDKFEKKVLNYQNRLDELQIEYNKQKIKQLQTGRLVARFKQLLDCHWADYECLRSRFIEILNESKYPLAKKLMKLLKNVPQLFNDKKEEIQNLISPNFANTNTIESFFGKYRLFFKKYRKIVENGLTKAIFELLRFRHNLSCPYTGPNNRLSPINRLGIKTKYQTYLDYLCPLT